MKKRNLLFFVFISIFLVCAFLFIQLDREKTVCINEKCFSAEVSDSPAKMAKGLMFRKSLGQDEGMLFLFKESGKYSFWMKNTLIPLDIIWIDSSNEIVFIRKNAMPCINDYCPAINPDKDAKYVLELNAGLSEKYNFSVGNKAEIY